MQPADHLLVIRWEISYHSILEFLRLGGRGAHNPRYITTYRNFLFCPNNDLIRGLSGCDMLKYLMMLVERSNKKNQITYL